MPQPVLFPLPAPPLDPFWSKPSQTSINYPRDGGARLHAGVDLVAHVGTQVLAMASGLVRRIAPFYEGTWAIEIFHPGLGLIRYGEVDAKVLVRAHQSVRQGDAIGMVGKRFGHPRAMLHLEWYSDGQQLGGALGADGPLSQLDNHPYGRRSDLIDPTQLLQSAPIRGWNDIDLHKKNGLTPKRQEQLLALLKSARMAPPKSKDTQSCLQ